MIGTTLSQPMPRMIDRLRDFESAKPSAASANGGDSQPFHVNISFFVAETREKAHEMMARNWLDSDVARAAPGADASSVGTSRHSFASGCGRLGDVGFSRSGAKLHLRRPARLHRAPARAPRPDARHGAVHPRIQPPRTPDQRRDTSVHAPVRQRGDAAAGVMGRGVGEPIQSPEIKYESRATNPLSLDGRGLG